MILNLTEITAEDGSRVVRVSREGDESGKYSLLENDYEYEINVKVSKIYDDSTPEKVKKIEKFVKGLHHEVSEKYKEGVEELKGFKGGRLFQYWIGKRNFDEETELDIRDSQKLKDLAHLKKMTQLLKGDSWKTDADAINQISLAMAEKTINAAKRHEKNFQDKKSIVEKKLRELFDISEEKDENGEKNYTLCFVPKEGEKYSENGYYVFLQKGNPPMIIDLSAVTLDGSAEMKSVIEDMYIAPIDANNRKIVDSIAYGAGKCKSARHSQAIHQKSIQAQQSKKIASRYRMS